MENPGDLGPKKDGTCRRGKRKRQPLYCSPVIKAGGHNILASLHDAYCKLGFGIEASGVCTETCLDCIALSRKS